jgi:hypothetical protein
MAAGFPLDQRRASPSLLSNRARVASQRHPRRRSTDLPPPRMDSRGQRLFQPSNSNSISSISNSSSSNSSSLASPSILPPCPFRLGAPRSRLRLAPHSSRGRSTLVAPSSSLSSHRYLATTRQPYPRFRPQRRPHSPPCTTRAITMERSLAKSLRQFRDRRLLLEPEEGEAGPSIRRTRTTPPSLSAD